MKSKVITSCHFNRPEYSRQMLEYLGKCKGIEDYTLVAGVEPGNEAVLKLLQNVNFCKTDIFINDKVLGVNENSYRTMVRGFQIADIIVNIEDDVLVYEDGLQIIERESYKLKEDKVFNICLHYNGWSDANIEQYNRDIHWDMIEYREWFTTSCIALSKDKFMAASEINSESMLSCSLDILINTYRRKNNMGELFPMVGRSQNIGCENGVNCNEHMYNKEWFMINVHCKYWAETML